MHPAHARDTQQGHGLDGKRAIFAALALLVVVTCAPGAFPPTPEPTPITHPTGPDELVLRIETSGGLIPPFRLPTKFPQLSVYGDGTVVTLGPQITIYPPPALLNVFQGRITEQGLQLLLREAAAAGLFAGDADYPLEGIYDAPTTFFTVNAGGRLSHVSVHALGLEDPSDPRLTPEQRAARQRLAEFARKALNLYSWLPPETVVERDKPFTITRLQVVVLPADAPEAPHPEDEQLVTTRSWALPTPLSAFGEPAPWFGTTARCGVVFSGNELSRLLEQLQTANQLTRWRSQEQIYVAFFRPLLPDERGCQPPHART